MNNILPTLKGLNAWTLKQKIKDHTTQKTSTIQLLQKIDIYHLNPADREALLQINDGKQQQQFIKKHGVLKRSTGIMKSHSFVRGFLQTFEAAAAHPYATAVDTVSILDTSNTARSIYAQNGVTSDCWWGTEAPATTTTYGIQVGTGITAPTSVDYVLETPIAHGTGAGQLQWGACVMNAAGVVGANVDLVMTRVFINGSSGSITLREIGLAIRSYNTLYYFLLAHDAVNQAIADSEVAVVGYIMRTTV